MEAKVKLHAVSAIRSYFSFVDELGIPGGRMLQGLGVPIKHLRVWISAVALLGVAAAFWQALGRNPEPESVREAQSEALQALEFWADQRAYPGTTPEGDQFYRAYLKTEDLIQRGTQWLPSADNWQTLGPSNRGGRTLALAVDPRNPNVVYAGSASGGLWRMTLQGSNYSWQYVDTKHPVLGVGAIAVDPRDSKVLYIGTGEVYGYGNSIGGLYVRTTRGSYGIGILKSTDSGATWTKSLDWSYNQQRGVQVLKMHPTNPDILFAGTSEGVFRTLDRGQTWTQVHNVLMAVDIAFQPGNPNTLYVACGNMNSQSLGVYRSTTGGESGSFQKLAGGLPATWTGKTKLGVSAALPNAVWADIANQSGTVGLFRSNDAGNTWTSINSTNWADIQGWYSHYVRIHPTNASRILLGGQNFWSSSNGGTSVQQVGNMHADHHCYADHPTNPEIVYFGGDGGVYQSTDGGSTFRAMSNGYITTQFYNGFASSPTNPNLALGGLQDNGSVRYTGTTSWTSFLGGDGAYCAIHPTNENIQYGSIYFLDIHRSTNGSSFSAITSGLAGSACFVAPFMLAPSQPSIIYGGKTFLYKSLDGGSNWQSMNGGQALNGNPILAIGVAANDPNTVYSATVPGSGRRASVFASVDGGQTHQNITGTLPDRYYVDLVVSPHNKQVVYITLSGFGSSHLYRSENGGQTWVDIGTTLPDVPTSALAIDPANYRHLYVGNDIGVFVSVDYGQTWTPWKDAMPTAALVMDLSLSLSNRKIRAVTHGNGVYERSLIPSDGSGISGRGKNGSIGLKVSGKRFEFTLPTKGDVKLEILDVRGKVLRAYPSTEYPAGHHRLLWDGHDGNGHAISAGSYVVRLKAGNAVKSAPLLWPGP